MQNAGLFLVLAALILVVVGAGFTITDISTRWVWTKENITGLSLLGVGLLILIAFGLGTQAN